MRRFQIVIAEDFYKGLLNRHVADFVASATNEEEVSHGHPQHEKKQEKAGPGHPLNERYHQGQIYQKHPGLQQLNAHVFKEVRFRDVHYIFPLRVADILHLQSCEGMEVTHILVAVSLNKCFGFHGQECPLLKVEVVLHEAVHEILRGFVWQELQVLYLQCTVLVLDQDVRRSFQRYFIVTHLHANTHTPYLDYCKNTAREN